MSMKAIVALVLVDLGRRDLAGDDLAEQAVGVGHRWRILPGLDGRGRHPPARGRRDARADRPPVGLRRASARRPSGSASASRRSASSARIERERAHGTYWWPLGLLSAAAALAGRAVHGRSPPPSGRSPRPVSPTTSRAGRTTSGACCPSATPTTSSPRPGTRTREQILLFIAHHDAAHGGFIFTPQLVTWVADALPRIYERIDTSPQVMQLVAGGPGARVARRAHRPPPAHGRGNRDRRRQCRRLRRHRAAERRARRQRQPHGGGRRCSSSRGCCRRSRSPACA